MATITDKTIQSYIRQSQKDTTKKYASYAIGRNLWLRVHTKTGNSAWLYRIAIPDTTIKSGYKFTNLTIGEYPAITLLKARLKAQELRAQVKDGINPVEAKKAELQQSLTLKDVWDKWIAIAHVKDITRTKLIGMYNNHISKIANQPIKMLNDKLAYDLIIQPILDNGNTRQAVIVLQKLKQLAKFAYETHLADINCFDRLVISKEYRTKKIRERTLSIEELKPFLLALDKAYTDQVIDIRNHHFIKLVLLLGTRKAELATAQWTQYNELDGTLLITETKTGDNLLIKLPHQAITLLAELQQYHINQFIFFGNKPNKHFCIRSILYNLHKITEPIGLIDVTIHDLRRTFSSRLTGLKYRRELIDKATNHRIQGTARYYQHDDMLDERYEMVQHWANWLDEVVK